MHEPASRRPLRRRVVRQIQHHNQTVLEALGDMTGQKTSKPLRILARPYLESQKSNPYQRLLYQECVFCKAEVARFTLRRLVSGRWNIWHYHWPESALIGLSRRAFPRAVVRALRYWVYLKIAKMLGVNIVWTVHNLHPHEPKNPRLERAWLRIFARNVSAVICLSRSGRQELNNLLPATRKKPTFIIPHGHYRGCYPDTVKPAEARRQLALPETANVALFLGMIRPYKNVTGLVDCFLRAGADDWALVVAGKTGSQTVRDEIEEIAAGCAAVRLRFGFVADDMLQTYFRAANLFIAPYADVLNSGSAILALSFDCPILVPNLGAMADLQDAVGRDWVMTYDGRLSDRVLKAAFDFARARRSDRAPLGKLDWPRIADLTCAAFHEISNGAAPYRPRHRTPGSGHLQSAQPLADR